MILKQAWYSSL